MVENLEYCEGDISCGEEWTITKDGGKTTGIINTYEGTGHNKSVEEKKTFTCSIYDTI